jgi:hypothetical protein
MVLTLTFMWAHPLYQKYCYNHNFKNKYGKKIYQLSTDKDYLLINDFIYKNSGISEPIVNHIIFAKKFIYLVFDYYYDGGLEGLENDDLWIFYPYHKEPMTVSNPIKAANRRLNCMARISDADLSSFKGIVLVNNSCKIAAEIKDPNVSFASEKTLRKVIRDFEAVNIKDLDQVKLLDAARQLNSMNERGK